MTSKRALEDRLKLRVMGSVVKMSATYGAQCSLSLYYDASGMSFIPELEHLVYFSPSEKFEKFFKRVRNGSELRIYDREGKVLVKAESKRFGIWHNYYLLDDSSKWRYTGSLLMALESELPFRN